MPSTISLADEALDPCFFISRGKSRNTCLRHALEKLKRAAIVRFFVHALPLPNKLIFLKHRECYRMKFIKVVF
jgi:hypothetical protein